MNAFSARVLSRVLTGLVSRSALQVKHWRIGAVDKEVRPIPGWYEGLRLGAKSYPVKQRMEIQLEEGARVLTTVHAPKPRT